MIGFIGLFVTAGDYTSYFSITHTLAPTDTSSQPLLCTDVSRTVPGISYQLLTATADRNRTAAVL
jgi:hypothetical protein